MYVCVCLWVCVCGCLLCGAAVLERECMVAREGERALQVENEGLGLQLRQKEQAILELRVTHDQLINQLNQEQVRTTFPMGQYRGGEPKSRRQFMACEVVFSSPQRSAFHV